MDFIISLAHFCEIHGPTSVLCTQISQGSCATCHPCDTPPAEDASKSSYFGPLCDSPAVHSLSSPFETPPTSPKSPKNSHNPYFPSLRDSGLGSFTSHLGDADTDYCENCTFLVPKNVSEQLPDGAPGSPTKDGRGRNGSPILRSSQSIMARGGSASADDDSSEDHSQASTSFSRSPMSLAPSSPASASFPTRNAHTHTLTYLTTRQPASPTAYSLLRRSCIRTLSCEVLPRGSSGPIYFGDPVAGYTIAYVFRLPDPRARGRLRTYALLALGGRDSWRVSMAMVKITEVFEQIATQIINMANSVLERETMASPTSPSVGLSTPPLSTSGGSSIPGRRASLTTGNPTAPIKLPPAAAPSPSPSSTRNITPVSSFLAAKKVDPDGYPRVSREVMRAKGLAEIVGNEKFFVELHARFCMLLSSLVKEFGTG
ncbi:uncharacterized protein K452DRAFT_316515 [Aplosporella prunicola CBS 121167]|uniref:UDENN FLCN/SMCR8-type domain-containing protein n=1 Tax=Aplosporella prunicola CBS 121167 TaxID=1176127 RepID=A0A6A6BK96_9PEZI|nr:uncharacterized protein K452DRAFT_316515 [Aplosporella prunicola CBS 121167]KAF2144539.1 hypothetical protein K452DRAFT_316515 [Aplosporella prunicola CBS 121167]